MRKFRRLVRGYRVGMELPPEFVEATVAAVQGSMPADFRVTQTGSTILRFSAPRGVPGVAGARPVRWVSRIGVRNRDGVSSQSLAWAVWLVLDDLVHMSRSTGLPWPKQASATLEAFAEAQDGEIRSWVTDGRGFRVDFDPINCAGVRRIAPSGMGRITDRLRPKGRLPLDGPITSPF